MCSNRSTSDVRNTQTKNKDMATVSVRARACVGVTCRDVLVYGQDVEGRAVVCVQTTQFFLVIFPDSHLIISFFGRFISTEGASSTAPPSALPTAAPSLATLLAVSLPLAATAVMARSFLGAA